jgi:gamma-glutamyltranspeptidase/glutathione hydrolase
MVVSDAREATKVGVDVLARGGNAIDAAVATAFALAVVYPMAGNIGGGGFMVARMGGSAYALDFRETAPAAATRDMYRGGASGPTSDSREGWRSAGVPGSVAGLWEAWRTLGSKRIGWTALVEPAIRLAEGGFPVSQALVDTIGTMRARLVKYPASASLFLRSGSPPLLGSTWRDADLAQVLRRISNDGPSGFYEGPVAAAIAQAMAENGGLITAQDLRGYSAKWRAPIEFDYRRHVVIGMPPPSSGGVTLAMIAHVLQPWSLRTVGWHSAGHIHLVAEAMRRAFVARNARLGDPDYVANPLEALLSEAWARRQRATIRMDRATATANLPSVPGSSPTEGPHTTHLSVVDAAGNAVALTTTINDWFGSGVTIPGLGFLLNDEMDDFASAPGEANMFGLVQGEPNCIAPGKRMLSSMSPTIVLTPAGDTDLLLGAAGGSKIITTVFQELSNAVDFGLNATEAVDAPRFHQQDLPDLLLVEPHGIEEGVLRQLEAMGHVVRTINVIGDGPAIGRAPSGWEGAAEPRRQGSLASGF